MVIEIEYFDLLPISYQNLLKDLFHKLDGQEEVDEQKSILKEFTQKNLVIAPIWKYYFDLEIDNHPALAKIKKSSAKHFVSIWAVIDDSTLKIIPKFKKVFKFHGLSYLNILLFPSFQATSCSLKKKEKVLFQALSFPHDQLDNILKMAKEFSSAPLPSEVLEDYEKNIILYRKLEAAFHNGPHEFFNTLLKIVVDDFSCFDNGIIQNIELIIGEHPYDACLWKKYFNFLESQNKIEALLNVYQRYLRIFIDDAEIAEKFDILKNNFKNQKSVGSGFPDTVAPKSSSIRVKEKIKRKVFDEAKFQILPFPKTLIHYIYENLNSKQILKLQMCAKHFHRILQFNIIHRLEISDEEFNFNKNSVNLPFKKFLNFNKIWLTNSLSIVAADTNKSFKRIISRIQRCDLKFIRFQWQKLTFNDLKFLCCSKNVEILHLDGCQIKEGKNKVSLEDIMIFVPKVVSFSYCASPITVTPQTASNLLKLNLENKLSFLELDGINGALETEPFAKFLKKNLAPKALVHLTFEYEDDFIIPDQQINEFLLAMDDVKESWEPRENVPKIIVFGPWLM